VKSETLPDDMLARIRAMVRARPPLSDDACDDIAMILARIRDDARERRVRERLARLDLDGGHGDG
jgi:hypothetical protein